MNDERGTSDCLSVRDGGGTGGGSEDLRILGGIIWFSWGTEGGSVVANRIHSARAGEGAKTIEN